MESLLTLYKDNATFQKYLDAYREDKGDTVDGDGIDAMFAFDFPDELQLLKEYYPSLYTQLYSSSTSRTGGKSEPPVPWGAARNETGPHVTHLNRAYTNLVSDKSRQLFDHVSSLGWTIGDVEHHMKAIIREVKDLSGPFVRGTVLNATEIGHLDKIPCSEMMRVGHIVFCQLLLTQVSEERVATLTGTRITRAGVSLVVAQDGLKDAPSDAEIARFCGGMTSSGKPIQYCDKPGLTAFIRYLQQTWDISLTTEGEKKKAVFVNKKLDKTSMMRSILLGRPLDAIMTYLKNSEKRFSNLNSLINEIQLWLYDNYEIYAKHILGVAACPSHDEAQAILKEVSVPKPECSTYSEAYALLRVHKEHNERNLGIGEVINTNNASPYAECAAGAKRATTLRVIYEQAVSYALACGLSNPKVLVKGEDKETYILRKMFGDSGVTIANAGVGKAVTREPVPADIPNSLYVDLYRDKGDPLGLVRLSNYDKDNAPAVLLFEMNCDKLPPQQHDFISMFKSSVFQGIRVCKVPGFHNAQFLVIACKRPLTQLARKAQPPAGEYEEVLAQCGKEPVKAYLPPYTYAERTPDQLHSIFENALKLMAPHVWLYENYAHAYYSRGLRPVPQKFKQEDMALPNYFLLPKEEVKFKVETKVARPKVNEKATVNLEPADIVSDF